MTAADRLAKKVRPELVSAAAADNLATATAHVNRALEILRPYASLRHRIEKPKAPGKTKEERKEERDARAARIRALVMERAADRCEWCGKDGMVLEWAHVFEAGERQAREDVDTTAAACADCHRRGWHSHGTRKIAAMRGALEWAVRLGFKDARECIERKLDKVLRVSGTPVRVEVRS